jgi:hypothetical protein
VGLLQNLAIDMSVSGGRVSLAQVLRAGVLDYPQMTDIIWRQASEERTLLTELEDMDTAWDDVQLVVKMQDSHYGPALFSISNLHSLLHRVRDGQGQLERIAKTSHLLGVVERFEKVEGTLLLLEAALQRGCKTQERFDFLRHMFAREDTQPSVRVEQVRYEHLLTTWRRMLIGIRDKKERRMLRHAAGPGGVLIDCTELLHAMEEMKHRFTDVLDTVRLDFPRFNFLGDQELLALIAGPRNPGMIAPALLHKIFPAVRCFLAEDVGKDASSLSMPRVQVLAWQGMSGEVVHLYPPLVADTQQSVEKWLLLLEETLHTHMRAQAKLALKGTATMAVRDWVAAFPAQSILLTDQIVWTDLVHGALHDISMVRVYVIRSAGVRDGACGCMGPGLRVCGIGSAGAKFQVLGVRDGGLTGVCSTHTECSLNIFLPVLSTSPIDYYDGGTVQLNTEFDSWDTSFGLVNPRLRYSSSQVVFCVNLGTECSLNVHWLFT